MSEGQWLVYQKSEDASCAVPCSVADKVTQFVESHGHGYQIVCISRRSSGTLGRHSFANEFFVDDAMHNRQTFIHDVLEELETRT